MKKQILLQAITLLLVSTTFAQNEKPVKGFIITAPEKRQYGWKEVKLVDFKSGKELQSIYKVTDDLQPLNSRSKIPVTKRDIEFGKMTVAHKSNAAIGQFNENYNYDSSQSYSFKAKGHRINSTYSFDAMGQSIDSYKPFSTNSAALAYDKKHERLYYTPMGINQLRYIDLKSKERKIYYFENEAFGNVSGPHDTYNMITRMVIASDGNGYALTNDANHLIKFTTGKKTEISDLGAITEENADGNISIHDRHAFGGDIIADVSDNLYLITATRLVYKISLKNRSSVFVGVIKGLPKGYTTNGAMVEGGSKVIVCSSRSTEGYFRFDLNTLEAEKISLEGEVFNGSDLANGNLAYDKKTGEENEVNIPEAGNAAANQNAPVETSSNDFIKVFPNPVTDGKVKLSFTDQRAGKYQVQILDISGKLLTKKEIIVNSKFQTVEIALSESIGKGTFIIKISDKSNNIFSVSKIIVQ